EARPCRVDEGVIQDRIRTVVDVLGKLAKDLFRRQCPHRTTGAVYLGGLLLLARPSSCSRIIRPDAVEMQRRPEGRGPSTCAERAAGARRPQCRVNAASTAGAMLLKPTPFNEREPYASRAMTPMLHSSETQNS